MISKKEIAVFFVSLVVFAGILGAGIFYYQARNKAENPPAPAPAAQAQNPQQSVETIPTSTIILSATSSAPTITPLSLPYSFDAKTATSSYWPKAWGTLLYSNGALTLVPDPSTRGANSFVNGASAWANYEVNADASPLMGGWFDIVARVSNSEQNFVYCEFGPNGTEVIERVDTADTQVAYAPASTTAATGVTENFGMEVYGNDVGCMMGGQEVVAARIAGNESPTGGIGFVTFGQPAAQKGVAVGEISVTPLSRETITVPFPPAPVSPPPPPPPPATPTEATTPIETLPYSIGTFNNAFVAGDGWTNWWGGSSESGGFLNIMATASSTGGGALLQGSGAWTDYTFQATVDWSQGETFGLVARYVDDNNYLVCEYDEKYVGEVHLRLDEHLDGNVIHLANGNVINYEEMGGPNIDAAIQVNGDQGECAFDGYIISSLIASNKIDPSLTYGEIGVTSWDPATDNSTIAVKSIGVVAGAYELGAYAQPSDD